MTLLSNLYPNIKGAQGVQGIQGTLGPQGTQGIQGIQGATSGFNVTNVTSPYTLQTSDVGSLISINSGVSTVSISSETFSFGNSFMIYNGTSTQQTIAAGAGVSFYSGDGTTDVYEKKYLEENDLTTILCSSNNDEFIFSTPLEGSFIPPLITTGLVLHLDPGDSSSYPGSGTTWYDLSGSGNDATLYNTPTHNASTNGGIFSFSKSQSEYAIIPGNYATTTSTVIAFARYTNTSSNGRVISANNNWLMGWHNNAIDKYYAEGWVTSSTGSTATTDWICYAATGNYSTDQWELYKNGTSIVGPNANGSQGPNTINIARSGQYGEYADCEVGVVLVYNRVLTSTEIQQNFDALKRRYGL